MTTESTPLLRDDSNVSPEDTGGRVSEGSFARRLSALDGFALLISIVIGSGVFSSPGPVDANVPSPGAALLVWFAGGLLAWTGALTMAELGTAIPGEGGIQPYLTHIYGELFGFLAGWSWIVATMPATLAILSIVFVESIYSSLGVNDPIPPLTHKLWSLLVLVVVSTLNSISTKTSTRLGKFFVVIKLLTIFLLMLAGLVVVFHFLATHNDLGGEDWHSRGWFAARPTSLADGTELDWSKVSTWQSLGFYSTALYGALWAYSGWDKANYVAAELTNPRKQLPLSINTAIPTIIICYVAANAVYYVLLPWNVVSKTDAAAVTAVTHFLGKGVAYLATVLICLVIAGSALGNSFVAGRMTVAAANKSWLPRVLGAVGTIGTWQVSKTEAITDEDATEALDKGESPINALILNTAITAVYILLGNMRMLLTLNGLAEYALFFLTVLGAIILRWREPGLHRPVKPVIVIPIAFAIVSGFVVVRGAIFSPLQGAVLVAIWLFGAVFYYVRRIWHARAQ